MLITEFVDVITYGKNIEHYKSLGYDTYYGSIITVPIEHLTLGSTIEVEVKCDYCGEHLFKRYKTYIEGKKDNNKDCCNDENCKKTKRKETCLKKYGVEYISQTEEHKNAMKDYWENLSEEEFKKKIDKRNQTNLKKYGHICTLHSLKIRPKVIKTFIKKYGYDNPSRSPKIKEKVKQTNFDKYGVYYYTQTNEYKERAKQTCLEKYGVEHHTMSEEFKDKYKTTCLNRYGVESYSETEDFKIKINKFWNSLSDEEIKIINEKRKKTCIDKYGVEHVNQNTEIKNKALQTLLNSDGILTSSQQIKVYEMIKELFNEGNVVLNYLLDYYVLDTALFINEIKIDIEYDGWYWHNKANDNRRNGYVKSKKWKILRIKSGNKIPTIEELKKSLDILINTDEAYQEIILDDWKEVAV